MKILWYNWRCWLNPAMGGAEVFTREVAKRWVKSGHEITLFTSEFPGCKKEEINDGVKIVRAGGRFSVYLKAKSYYKKRFSKEGFDIVIDEINTVPFFTPKFVKNGEKVVVLIHQLAREYWFYELPFPISSIGYHFLEENWLKNYVDLPTVTVSESSKSDLIDLKFNNVHVVPEGLNFLPLTELPDKTSNPVIVYSGRLKQAKRPDHAIKAFKLVRKKVPNAELWVIGSGPFKKKLENLAGEGVRFFGYLSNEERRCLIRKAWVLINPSVREGWGLNIIESNALGLPAVAYDVSGLRDSVQNNKTGLLAKAGDIDDLAFKINELLNDKDLMERLKQNALNYSKNFSWDKAAEVFFSFLQDVQA